MAYVWTLTSEIITNPETFIGKEITIGSQYSYVADTTPIKFDESLFRNYKVLATMCKNNTVYVLVEGGSMESAKQLQSSFIFKGMTTLPDFYDNRTYKTVSYIVSVKIPDDNIYTFSQLLPIE